MGDPRRPCGGPCGGSILLSSTLSTFPQAFREPFPSFLGWFQLLTANGNPQS